MQFVCHNQGLEPFEFISIGLGTGPPKIKWLLRFGSGLKKIKVPVPDTKTYNNFEYLSGMRV